MQPAAVAWEVEASGHHPCPDQAEAASEEGVDTAVVVIAEGAWAFPF